MTLLWNINYTFWAEAGPFVGLIWGHVVAARRLFGSIIVTPPLLATRIGRGWCRGWPQLVWQHDSNWRTAERGEKYFHFRKKIEIILWMNNFDYIWLKKLHFEWTISKNDKRVIFEPTTLMCKRKMQFFLKFNLRNELNFTVAYREI